MQRFTKREFQLMTLAGVASDIHTASQGDTAITKQAADQLQQRVGSIAKDVIRGTVAVEDIGLAVLEAYSEVSSQYLKIPESDTDITLQEFFITIGALVLGVTTAP